MQKFWDVLKGLLFSKGNKEFLIFLSFLALSGVFWLFMTLNETYEREFSIPVTVTNVPKNVVLTSDETDTVRMTIRDKGITLVTYMYGNGLRNIRINFNTYARNNGTGIISAGELQKLAYQQLASGSQITSVKPDKMEYYFNYGAKKRVPVRWSGRVIPDELFFISRVQYWPDSVDVYASKEKLDSISTMYTEQLNYVNFRDTLFVNVHLSQGINMPPGKVLRTFPSRVTVHFVAGASVYKNLTYEDFTVVADYKEMKASPSEKCRIYLKKAPPGISRARLSIDAVDYLIEEDQSDL